MEEAKKPQHVNWLQHTGHTATTRFPLLPLVAEKPGSNTS